MLSCSPRSNRPRTPSFARDWSSYRRGIAGFRLYLRLARNQIMDRFRRPDQQIDCPHAGVGSPSAARLPVRSGTFRGGGEECVAGPWFRSRQAAQRKLRQGAGRARRKARREVIDLSEPRHKICFSKTGVTVDTDETVTLLELAEAHGMENDYACRISDCGEVKFAGRSVRKGSSSSLEKNQRERACLCLLQRRPFRPRRRSLES
jgi:hypothetical protein